VSEAVETRPDIEKEKMSDMRENFKKGVLFVVMLLLLVTTFQLYFLIQQAIDTWFEYQYVPIFKAVYCFFVLLVCLYIIRLYVLKR
jgi:putative copper export protein